MTTHRYWKLTSSGDRHGQRRWDVRPEWPLEVEWRLRTGEWIYEWPEEHAQVSCEPTDDHEDMPWPRTGTSMIVSSPLRAFIDREAPGSAQFLAVHMVGPGAQDLAHPYWVANWLRTFDCLDKPRSYNESDGNDEYDSPYVEVPVIDPTRIPADGVLGRIRDYHIVVLVRDDLRNKMQEAGFHGPQFYPIYHSTDAGAPPPTWKPGARRR